MDEMNKNKMDDMEMDKVSGGFRPKDIKYIFRPRPRCHDSNANSMAANIDETQNARWREIAKVKPD